MLEKCIKIESIKTNTSKRSPNCNIINAIGSNNPKTPKGLIKAENTIATLLKTGIIRLKDWLY